ncbi:amidophosphoribosyltransferase [Kappamyces sp. JEL0680]|nr:amidophosphoribosyltransferase [Kappamyces sp. JEL0680]
MLVRYPTAGTSSMAESQPFYVNSPYGLVSAHNGNLTNTGELRRFLDETAHRHVNTDSDSEVLLNIFAEHLQRTQKSRQSEFGTDWMIASESVVLDSLGYSNFKDVGPGEAVIITKKGIATRQCSPALSFTPCIFEYVYFARPDSIIDGISVYKARLAMGEALARQVVRQLGENNDIDVVIPVPDTSRSAALQVGYALNKVYREGFIKNRYIARTFIMPGQSQRIKNVRRKLNPMPMEFAGKVVLLVDGKAWCFYGADSIVRGTTSREIINMARDAGAKKVYFASCAPAIRYPNVYGIDMPTRQELIAYKKSDSEIAKEIGADEIIFQDLNDLVESVSKYNPNIKEFDVSVFTGCYVTGDVDEKYFLSLEKSRSASTQLLKIPSAQDVLGLHNNFLYHGIPNRK